MPERDGAVERHSDGRRMERRTLLRGVAVGGAVSVGGALLASCVDDPGVGQVAKPEPTVAAPSTPESSDEAGVLVATDQVPEGGGVILADDEIVVTQPASGEFKGFSAICTHNGCTVADVTDGLIICPCHGSQYSVDDGSVVAGPAPAPLPEVPVKVKDGDVVRV